MKYRLIIILLSLLGYGSTSCSRTLYDCPTPPAFRHYEVGIKGTVTDHNGRPIQGIVVRKDPSRSVTTDRNGKYRIEVERETTDGFPLTFTDADGPRNGGDFLEKRISIEPAEEDKIGDETVWTLGRYEKTADVILEEKQQE